MCSVQRVNTATRRLESQPKFSRSTNQMTRGARDHEGDGRLPVASTHELEEVLGLGVGVAREVRSGCPTMALVIWFG